MRRQVFLDQSARMVFHAVLIGSIYLLFAGHNQPGGGFAGGLVAGAAIALRYLAGGIDDVRAISRFRPWTVLGSGLTLSAAIALAPLLKGQPVLTSMGHEFDLPLLGHAYASTTLAFDLGVYTLVIGLVLMVFEAFGDDAADDTVDAEAR
ncbi:MAG TPA: MnhB domain-containing protein [Ilumatobacteraceae bacterium]|nr:MnhB domain-containing protein [Ilumatobacteraceae bacterium]